MVPSGQLNAREEGGGEEGRGVGQPCERDGRRRALFFGLDVAGAEGGVLPGGEVGRVVLFEA